MFRVQLSTLQIKDNMHKLAVSRSQGAHWLKDAALRPLPSHVLIGENLYKYKE